MKKKPLFRLICERQREPMRMREKENDETWKIRREARVKREHGVTRHVLFVCVEKKTEDDGGMRVSCTSMGN